MSILIVIDDNQIDRLIIHFCLVKYPVSDSIHYFDGGLSFINYIKDNKDNYVNLPDVIFLDLRMPDYDGWHVLEDIKKINRTLPKNIKVYIISASVSAKDRFRALQYNFVHQFISKPITKDILISIANEIAN
jgi:CheY-like chemotaxis protein